MAEERNEYTVAVEALKRLLKIHKITYRELATGIGMSESGVKKALGARDGSFERLAKMCKYAGISLSDLLSEGEKELIDVRFTDKQQEALIQDMPLFHFYWRLVYERLTVEQIEAEMKLNKKDSFRRLRQLDGLGLIQLLPQGRLRLPSLKTVRWVGDGPLIRKLYREWSSRMVHELARPGHDPNHLFLIRYFKMSQKTYQDLLEAQQSLEKEFLRRSIREMRTNPEGLQHVRWVSAIDDRSFVS